MNLKASLILAIQVAGEDLNRLQAVQQASEGPLPGTEARQVKDYITALAGAFRAAQDIDNHDPEIATMSDDLLIEEFEKITRKSND